MAVWEKAKVRGTDPASRVDVDEDGASWVKFLGEKHRNNDGNDYGTIGKGIDLIFGGVEA